MRPIVALVAVGVAVGCVRALEGGSLKLEGFGWVRGVDVTGQPPWLEGGFGRLTEGAGRPGDSRTLFRSQAQVGLDWKPSETWLVRMHGLARQEDRAGGSGAGIAEAFVQFRPELSPRTTLRFRAGTFFPQTSRENVRPQWSSPYTLTLSALNTWIAEEVRLTGVEGALILAAGRGGEVELAGTIFGANDTMGTLLAWRGWSFGDRLTAIGETLPLPPLPSFRPGGGFSGQQVGTRPIDELDRRPGWAGRARWRTPGRVLLQGEYLDNRGDRELHTGQYAWRTRFGQVGGEVRFGDAVILVAEGALGDAGMGLPDAAHVDVRFRVGYVLLSWGGETARLSVRYDGFRNEDRDGTAEPGDESGSAWTAAAFWSPERHVRLGVELLDLRSRRPAAAFSGAEGDTDARRLTAELRLVF